MVYASRFLRYDVIPMYGPDVLEVQEKLAELGYYQGELDGVFTEKLGLSVKVFQESYNLPADGIVDAATWNYLSLRTSVVTEYSYQGQPSIVIDIDRRILLFVSTNFVKTYQVAVGKKKTPTPLGNWTIVSKALNPGGPFGVRWMRLSVPWGGYGIHGTNNPKSIGKAVSHGCIRLYNEDVVEVYDLTPIGTSVIIVGKAYASRTLKLGDKGLDVKEVQRMLKRLGYYRASLDGDFGLVTKEAVIKFQKAAQIPPDGVVGPVTLTALQKAYAVASGERQP
ncbi:MAG: peptidoglycan-binding protein [Syntrophomonadaceae bacterium]|nr:peptidoglycan-binding protein [Syntrophomonadaceae bacterium]